MLLVHVTSQDRVASILEQGLRGPSCWSIDEKIVATYTFVQHREGRQPAWFLTSLNLFDESVLQPDMPSIYEPVSAALDRSEEEIADQWSRVVNGDWRDTLRIVGSLVITTVVPPQFLQLITSPKAMMGYLQSQTLDALE